MEICMNKKTNKTFIHLDELGNGRALMVTPQGDVKPLEYGLFTEIVEIEDERAYLSQGRINAEQYSTYRQYHQMRPATQ